MSFDEYLQSLFETYFKFSDRRKKKRRQQLLTAEKTVKLDDIRDRLTLLARALTGEPIRIFPAEREGGYKDTRFFLPEFFSACQNREDNFRFYLFRLLFLITQRKLQLNYPPGHEADDEQARADALRHAPAVLDELFKEFPVTRQWYDILKKCLSRPEARWDMSFLYGKWMTESRQSVSGNPSDTGDIARAIQQEIDNIKKARPAEDMQVKTVDRKQQEDQVIHNYFEKIETIEEHTGGIWRDFDGTDELDEHENALNEVRMRNVIRTGDEARSVYQTDFAENISVPEAADDTPAGERFFLYDEWDYKRRQYKKDYCKLFPRHPETADYVYYRKTLEENRPVLNGLRKILANLRNRHRETRRQFDGEHFDIDALTDWHVDLKAKRTPDERIYIANRTPEKDVSILLLIDMSMSSDGYAAGNRIIDVEKQTALLFGEILNEFQTDFAIHAFFSKTRNRAEYMELKNFHEAWQTAAPKIAAVQPQGYTRIGTALRHAGTLLEDRPFRDKWIILLSDGKPNDYDRYEGKYGMEDIKQALRELKMKNIRTYALAIEAQAKFYLPEIFGINRYQILTSPYELLKALIKLYEIIKFEA